MSHPAKNNDTPHQSGQREADTSQPLSADHVYKLLKLGLEPLRGEKEPSSDSGTLQGQMAHTPGPWSFQHERFNCQDKTNAQIEAPYSGNYAVALVYSGRTTNIADARLIAAAPELLDTAIEAYTVSCGVPCDLKLADALGALYRAVIKATEGQTP